MPASSPVEASSPIPQFQEYLHPPKIHNHQRKRRPEFSIETGAERPPKRARLTKKNLETSEEMGGQGRKSAAKKSSRHSSSTTTTTDEDLGTQRQSKSKTSNSDTRPTRSKQSISTTDSGFQDAAFSNGILDPDSSKPPANLKSRQERINRSRNTENSLTRYERFAMSRPCCNIENKTGSKKGD